MERAANGTLTAGDRQLLELLAAGRTVGEAAAFLKLAPRTAERRLAAARTRLGATTNAQALMKLGLAAPGRRAARLSRRQREVLALVGEGLRDHEIAERLGIAPSTVGSVIRSAMAALGAHTRTQAVASVGGNPVGHEGDKDEPDGP